MNLPQDFLLAVSILNTHLRDQFASLSDLCEDANLDYEELLQKIDKSGYIYDSVKNQIKLK